MAALTRKCVICGGRKFKDSGAFGRSGNSSACMGPCLKEYRRRLKVRREINLSINKSMVQMCDELLAGVAGEDGGEQ